MSAIRGALVLCWLNFGPAADPVVIRVEGEVSRATGVTAEAFGRLPRQKVVARGPEGKDASYEGVAVVDLLRAAGVEFGTALKGPGMAEYLVVEASDGYRAVFALPELDPACTDRVILVADRRDGRPLDPGDGPLRVIVPGEKRHSRWVKKGVALKVGRA